MNFCVDVIVCLCGCETFVKIEMARNLIDYLIFHVTFICVEDRHQLLIHSLDLYENGL